MLRHAYCEIPFKITRVFNSRQPLAHLIVMHCTAGLFGGDELECSIRVERGARWRFRELASETQLRSNNRLVYLDRFVLLPNGFERSARAMGDCSYAGTGLYVGEQARSFATILHQALPDAGIDSPADEVAISRIVSMTGPDFHRCREMFCLHAVKGT